MGTPENPKSLLVEPSDWAKQVTEEEKFIRDNADSAGLDSIRLIRGMAVSSISDIQNVFLGVGNLPFSKRLGKMVLVDLVYRFEWLANMPELPENISAKAAVAEKEIKEINWDRKEALKRAFNVWQDLNGFKQKEIESSPELDSDLTYYIIHTQELGALKEQLH